MPIDVHAHYVPAQTLAAIRTRGAAIGVTISGTAAQPAIAFPYGFSTRPLFPRLTEPVADRLTWLDTQGIDHQLVATWPDMFGCALEPRPAAAWHRLLNETLGEWCDTQRSRFSWIASIPIPHAAEAVAELDWAASHGAVGVMLPANVEGANIGELPLDPVWARAEALRMPVILHPLMVTPAPRAARFALAQVVQYTFDTTLGAGSLIGSGVFDRFPALQMLLSHGGGALPWLAGRFDIMYDRMDRQAQGMVAAQHPSDYLGRLWFDTITHHPAALRFLKELAGLQTLVLGSDYSFPPADLCPVVSLQAAGFSPAEIRTIADENPRRLFQRLAASF
jgi:aminocarboxymuconate-semialdehyde decarboxylase